jgi:SAM-dependent methyltransferase
MRNFENVNRYLDELLLDIYPQPPDEGHTKMAQEVMQRWIANLIGCKSVLDVGCGQAFLQPDFEKLEIEYIGVTLGEDYKVALKKGYNVYRQDFSFLDFPDKSFDLVWARHSLEHSFSPLISLMEWHRVARSWLCLIAPTPEYWGWAGRNHISIAPQEQLEFLLARAGWGIIWTDFSDERELRFVAEKRARKRYLDGR